MVIDTLINGVIGIQPTNLQDVKLVISNENDVRKVEFDGELTWGINDLRDPNDPFSVFNKIIQQGANGGNGILEAQDLMLIARERGRSIVIADAMIDLWSATYDFEKREISAPVLSKGGTDWISEKTEGLTFDFLMSEGVITPNDFILCPYVVEKETQTIEKILVSLTAFTIITQIRTQVQEIQEMLSEASGLSPWTAVLKVSQRVIFIGSLLLLLAETIAKIVNLLIQPVKYISGMSIKRHFEVGFSYLGMQFSSSIFDNEEKDLVIFPEKYFTPKNREIDNIKGWILPDKTKQNGYYKGDFLSFINIFRSFFNAKIIVDQPNKTVYFERRDFVGKVANFTLPSVWAKQRFNKEDFKANYLLEFQPDVNDRHTISDYQGTSVQVGMKLSGVFEPQRSLLTGGKTISVPFSLFKVKTELSDVEIALKAAFQLIETSLNVLIKIVNATITALNAILKVINKIIKFFDTLGLDINVNIAPIPQIKEVNLTKAIEDRVGMFKMEDDIVTVPKIAYVKNTPNAKNNKQIKPLVASDILERYHSIDFFSRNSNQYIEKEAILTGITFDEVYDIINADELQGGAKLINMSWSPFNHTAEISVKIPYIYAYNNLTEVNNSPDGS